MDSNKSSYIILWCQEDKKSIKAKSDSTLCTICKQEMKEIGWIEEM